MQRLFIAVELPPDLKQRIKAMATVLRGKDLGEFRWVRPENIHLTLKFLGETPAERLSEITAAMTVAVRDIEPFILKLGKTGVFPSMRRPRVFWLGLDESLEQLMELQATLQTALKAIGFAEERDHFVPHLTLARIPRSLSSMERVSFESQWPLLQGLELPALRVERISLMESQLSQQGARYLQKAMVYLDG